MCMEELSSIEYIKYRANQALKYDINPVKFFDIQHNDLEISKALTLVEGKRKYIMIFIEPAHRGKGFYEVIYNNYFSNYTVLTFSDCHINNFLATKKIPHYLYPTQYSIAYDMIMKYYGTKKAHRSQVNLMNHIEEGIVLLQQMGCDSDTIDAYCLHPILQSDNELIMNYHSENFNCVNARTLILAMEYRKTANAYLSQRIIESINDIELSPLPEVNQMLIADKIQNYKDFVKYHKHSHQRSKELQEYFENWMKKLQAERFHYQFIDRLNLFDKVMSQINVLNIGETK